MAVMKLTVDHHVHTRYSNCCREDYGLREIIETQIQNGMEYACVTDHIHSSRDTAGLSEHHAAYQSLPERLKGIPVYIGAELTFSSPEGHVPVDTAALEKTPAFTIGGCHHIPWDSRLTMGDIPGSRAIVAAMNEQSYFEMLKKHHILLKGAVEKEHIDILAHPYDFFFRLGIFDTRMLDMFHDIVLLCKKHRVAIEINNASAKRCLMEEERGERFNGSCISPKSFYSGLIKMAMDEKVPLSPASDAHAQKDIGYFEDLYPFLLDAGTSNQHLFRIAKHNIAI